MALVLGYLIGMATVATILWLRVFFAECDMCAYWYRRTQTAQEVIAELMSEEFSVPKEWPDSAIFGGLGIIRTEWEVQTNKFLKLTDKVGHLGGETIKVTRPPRWDDKDSEELTSSAGYFNPRINVSAELEREYREWKNVL